MKLLIYNALSASSANENFYFPWQDQLIFQKKSYLVCMTRLYNHLPCWLTCCTSLCMQNIEIYIVQCNVEYSITDLIIKTICIVTQFLTKFPRYNSQCLIHEGSNWRFYEISFNWKFCFYYNYYIHVTEVKVSTVSRFCIKINFLVLILKDWYKLSWCQCN